MGARFGGGGGGSGERASERPGRRRTDGRADEHIERRNAECIRMPPFPSERASERETCGPNERTNGSPATDLDRRTEGRTDGAAGLASMPAEFCLTASSIFLLHDMALLVMRSLGLDVRTS